MRCAYLAFGLLLLSCSSSTPEHESPCAPGQQVACACPGGAPDGVQVCLSDGSAYGACTGCAGGSASTASGSATAGAGGGSGGSGGSGGDPGSGGGGGDDCTTPDKDMDGASSTACGGDDCDDQNAEVFVGQVEYFGAPRANGSFDYDCNGAEDKEFATVMCAGGLCTAKTSVFLSAAMCGQMAIFGDCNALCQTSNQVTKAMRCR